MDPIYEGFSRLPKDIIVKIIRELDIIKHSELMIAQYGCDCRALYLHDVNPEENWPWAECIVCGYPICEDCTVVSLDNVDGGLTSTVDACKHCARQCQSCSKFHLPIPQEESEYASRLSYCFVIDNVSEEDARRAERDLNPSDWEQCISCQHMACCCYSNDDSDYVCASCIRDRHFTAG